MKGAGVKLAHHLPGERVEDPAQVDRALRAGDADSVIRCAREVMPGIVGAPLKHAVCLYEMSPDEHFVLDLHPKSADADPILAPEQAPITLADMTVSIVATSSYRSASKS